jgi:hypothetical protein
MNKQWDDNDILGRDPTGPLALLGGTEATTPTQRVIQKQKYKEKVEENRNEEDEEGIEVDEDDL